MNFYSDHLLANIIDNTPLDNLIETTDSFKEGCNRVIKRYSNNTIYHRYVDWILNDPHTVVALYCIDHEFSIQNTPSILVYRKVTYNHEVRYYILLICTARKFRSAGYGTLLLNEFQRRIRSETKKPTKIILSSIEEAVLFYEAYGFKWTREPIQNHPILLSYEYYDPEKEYFILELHLGPNGETSGYGS